MEMVKVADFEDKTEAPEALETEPPKRKRGRPPGQPKTGGRQKATANWTSATIRDALLERSNAVDVLADIVAGRQLLVAGPTGKEHWSRPSMQERLRATELLLKKILPDLQAQSIEMTGKDGKDLIPEQQDARQLSRAILSVLGEAVLDDAPEPVSEPMPRAQHELTAQRYEEVDEVDALDLSDEAAPVVGERILIGPVGCWVELVPDGRWRAMHSDGSLHRYFKSRDEAEQQAADLRW